MIQVVPVIDLQRGVVVRGIAGQRAEYRPLQSALTPLSTPQAVAHALREQFGFSRCYVADLDAIADLPPQTVAWRDAQQAMGELWIDAGVTQAASVLQYGHAVLGLESLASPEQLAELVDEASAARMLFSLDLRAGRLWTSAPAWQSFTLLTAAQAAIECGLNRLVLLDIADVGAQRGTSTLALATQLRERWPNLVLIGGGGVRSIDDLHALDRAGFNYALVASALHDGRLTCEALREGGFLPQG